MALGEVFIYYFGFNFLFVVSLAYKIIAATEIPNGWRTWNVPILSIVTGMALMLIIGLIANKTAGSLAALLFLLTMWKGEYEKKLFGRVSKGLTRPILYLLVLFVISFAAVYWKTNLPVLGIPLGIIHLAYAGLVYYVHKTLEEGGMWRA